MLSEKVKELEDAYSRLHHMAGMLLATIAMPANQTLMREGRGLDMVFNMVKRDQETYWKMPHPEEPQRGEEQAARSQRFDTQVSQYIESQK